MSSLRKKAADLADRPGNGPDDDADESGKDGLVVFLGDAVVHLYEENGTVRAVVLTEAERSGPVRPEAVPRAAGDGIRVVCEQLKEPPSAVARRAGRTMKKAAEPDICPAYFH